MKLRTFKPGDPCPKCGEPLERRAGMFFWRGQMEDGAVCPRDNALWPISGEEIKPLQSAT
jgi:hypothetical protein